jgi:hypothetical protein
VWIAGNHLPAQQLHVGTRLVPAREHLRRAVAALLCCTAVTVGLAACSGDDDTQASPYCARVAEIDSLDLLADPAPDKVHTDLEQLLALTRRAAAVAPAAIRDDMHAAVDAQVRFNAVYAAHGWDRTATQRAPEFLALAGDPHLAEVYTRLERYQLRECPVTTPHPSVKPI